ncbi:Fis family transcriptional regulator, partial [Escherichia coli]|nr:Fis family transcriptional regulator [Escherichia coli]
MITAKQGIVSFQYLLEEQPPTQVVTVNEKQLQPVTQVLTLQQIKELEVQNLTLAVQQCEGKIFGQDGAAKL